MEKLDVQPRLFYGSVYLCLIDVMMIIKIIFKIEIDFDRFIIYGIIAIPVTFVLEHIFVDDDPEPIGLENGKFLIILGLTPKFVQNLN